MVLLSTDRLRLAPITMDDASDLQALANDDQVSALSLNFTPFSEDAARTWIAEQQSGWKDGTRCTFAIRVAETGAFIGVAALMINRKGNKAELGYATMPSAWGKGYATEACRAVVRYAFDELGLTRLTANHLLENAASARVLAKLGFREEARLQPESAGGDASFGIVFWGMMREEYIG